MNVEICAPHVSTGVDIERVCRTHHTSNGREPGPEEVAAILAAVVGSDVLDSGIPDMAYDEDSGCSGGRNSAEIVSKGEDRPAVGDSAESRIRSIREPAVVDKLGAHDGILAGLPGRTLSLRLEEESAYTSPTRCGRRTLSVA